MPYTLTYILLDIAYTKFELASHNLTALYFVNAHSPVIRFDPKIIATKVFFDGFWYCSASRSTY